MDEGFGYALLGFLLAAVVAVLAWSLWRFARKNRELGDFEHKEERMFDYLRELGEATGADTTRRALDRMIVEGVRKVVRASGGALYLLDENGEVLEPRYLSEDCPALVDVPEEVKAEERNGGGAIDSFLRLAGVQVGEGVPGRAMESPDARHVPDLERVELLEEIAASGRPGGRRSAMTCPLRYGGKDLGVLVVTRNANEADFSKNDLVVFRSAADQSAFALGNALLYQEASLKRQLESDLRSAREVQHVLLPQGEPKVPGFRIFGDNVPARIISGDYYDYLDLGEGRHGLVIADVSGKGVAAGLLMAMCRSVLRAKAEEEQDPAEVLAGVNRALFPDIREDMFISLFYGVIEGDEGRIRVARAGHDAALLYRAAPGRVESVKPKGLALGVDEGGVFERVTESVELQLEAGDCLLFYTDGVKEATDPDGDEFGMERLEEEFLEAAPLGAEVTVSRVREALARHAGEQAQMDDVTLLAVEKR